MRYSKPKIYDDFTCVAGECPDTCCAGWQIMIDEESLAYYGEVKGDFGRRLCNSIDWQEGAFYQCNRRCAFLNEADLCDIYTELGEEALCNTCKNYPRHIEEYEGLRELSLSLSCPIAAKMILEQEDFPAFVEYEDEKEEELADEFEDFDLLLFTQLEDARTAVLKHLQESKMPLGEKLSLYLEFADRMQECVEVGAYFEIQEAIRAFEACEFEKHLKKETISERFRHRETLFQHMIGLERLREEWNQVLTDLNEALYIKGENSYKECLLRLDNYLQEEDARKQWEQVGVQLFVFFLYTYFCGAVYDDWIYSKMALAVESVRFIRELYIARLLRKGSLSMEDYVELAYRYAREIEHSDDNLNTLEELFSENREMEKE